MRLAIFGGTGTVGSALLTQALDAGHDIRALVRAPSKLGGEHARLTVVQGDAREAAAVQRTVAGCDSVLSTLGATSKDAPDTRRAGTAHILAAMQEHGIRRLVVMGGFHLHVPGDRDNVGQRLIVPILKLRPHLVEDTTAMRATELATDLDWKLVRAPRVVGRRSNGACRTGTLSLGPWSKVPRGAVASFMLECLEDDASIRQAPMISA